jgi:hypothetical protein
MMKMTTDSFVEALYDVQYHFVVVVVHLQQLFLGDREREGACHTPVSQSEKL